MLVAVLVATFFEEGLELLVHVLFVEFHEMNANGCHLVLDFHHVRLLDNLLKHGCQFLLRLSFNLKLDILGVLFVLQLLVVHDFRQDLVLGDGLLNGGDWLFHKCTHVDTDSFRQDRRLIQHLNHLFFNTINSGRLLSVFHFNSF